jgi:serine/threonine protein kinase
VTLQVQVSSFAPGQVLSGRFEVGGAVASDGFGPVLAATDRKTMKPVTLRLLRGATAIAAVKQQLRTLGSNTHPNLVDPYGVVALENGDALLVQGPLAGHHLADYVRQHAASGKPLSLRGAYNVVAHVCNALSFAHASGPHGAVRPNCVWIGEDGRVQLADLVLARVFLAYAGVANLPETDGAYLAPEIKAGHQPLPQSDIFGVGALLYVMLTGRSPMDDFVAPSQVHPEVTPAIDAQLFRALAPDPSQRHASPDELRSQLLAVIGDTAASTSDDFGVDVEIEVNLASLSPRARSSRPPAELQIPKAPRMPGNASSPQAGMRVSMHEDFRVSMAIDESEAEAARSRSSLGEIDLKDALAKITEDDAPRWMVVKQGMDHGPFSGRQLVNMIVQGEALREHELLNTDDGRRGKIGEFAEFTDFLAQYEMRRSEVQRAQALASAETKEKRSAVFKLGVGAAIVAVVALAGGIYAITRSGAGSGQADAELDDLYKRGQVDITGSAGILPVPRGGSRRSGGGGGGGGGGLSYEDAMMQAVDIGSASGGGESQLSPATVAGVMNKNLNRIAGACVHGSVGTVKIDMAIAGNGQVLGVSVNGGDGSTQRCVANEVRRIRFPSFGAPRMGARFTFGT